MRDLPLPPELAQAWGNNADIRYRGNNEWSSACPHCNPQGRGGRNPSDRFRMFLTGGPPRAWCRGCDRKVIAKKADGTKPTPLERAQAREAHSKWLREENKRLRQKVKWLQSQNFWQRWHYEMTAEGRDLWHGKGVSDFMINTHKLGYTMERYQEYGGAMTIPFMHPDIQTLQLRLMVPPETDDKYRFQKGTKASWFYPWPQDTIENVTLVLEGAVKSMVTWQSIATTGGLVFQGVPVTIVAAPSKNIPNAMLSDLDKADLVILLIDPDAYVRQDSQRLSAMERNVRAIGEEKCRHIQLPDKVDDLILEYDLGHAWLQDKIDQASPFILPDPARRPTTQHL